MTKRRRKSLGPASSILAPSTHLKMALQAQTALGLWFAGLASIDHLTTIASWLNVGSALAVYYRDPVRQRQIHEALDVLVLHFGYYRVNQQVAVPCDRERQLLGVTITNLERWLSLKSQKRILAAIAYVSRSIAGKTAAQVLAVPAMNTSSQEMQDEQEIE